MAAAKGPLTGIQTKAYALLAAKIAPAVTFANVEAGVITAGALIEDVTSIGDISLQDNSITFSVFGQDTQKSLAGPQSPQPFTFGVALNNLNALQKSLRDASAGTSINVAILETDTEAGPGKTVCFLFGQISSVAKSQTPDGVSTLTISVALSEKPIWLDE